MELDADEIEPFRNFNNNQNNQMSEFDKKCHKIYKKTSYSLVRLVCLFIFFYLDDFNMTVFIKSIVDFLLIHESLVLTNFLILEGIFLYEKLNYNNFPQNNETRNFPNICKYLNSINNM